MKRKRLASIGARRIQDRFLDLIDSILLSWKILSQEKPFKKLKKTTDSKKENKTYAFRNHNPTIF
ncbi:hypothetical protein LEP1GSC083_1701 [Leptospira interrogans serovar Pyrogenes str. L0374]|uniref:Uncharacterized protein n=1 Tax=Leptospira interrogans serovar Pyrogenes str. L0374 TaxID=1049928 RepID=M6KZ30_LEPIR|nr:hypothetical protein LEP1GSC083_1701 [Leptospira interrogans serovar Pyrogenes str. L0374]